MDVNPYESPQVVIAARPAEPVPQGRPVGVWVATIWAGLFAASGAIARFFTVYFSVSRWPLFVGAGLALSAGWLAPNADTKIAAGVAIVLSSACVILLRVRGDKRGRAVALAALVLPWIALLIARSSDVLDNGVYVFFALLLTALAISQQPVSGAAPDAPKSSEKSKLTIDGISFRPEDVRAVHSAGNYSQVEFVDGSERHS